MATRIWSKAEINTIQHDANKVLQDISKLSSRLGVAGLEAVETSGDRWLARCRRNWPNFATEWPALTMP